MSDSGLQGNSSSLRATEKDADNGSESVNAIDLASGVSVEKGQNVEQSPRRQKRKSSSPRLGKLTRRKRKPLLSKPTFARPSEPRDTIEVSQKEMLSLGEQGFCMFGSTGCRCIGAFTDCASISC